MGCTNLPIDNDQFHDMSWYISKSSGTIQLNPLLPLNVVYQRSHYSGTIGKLWDEHHSKFAEFILKFSPENVLEIGGLNGTLAKKCKSFVDIDWTIIDPNPSSILSEYNIDVIKGFFDENFVPDKKYKMIVHSHLLEHVYDINKFLKNIQNILKQSYGKMIFSIPNMEVMLKQNNTNCLNFEHTYYLSEDLTEYYLNKYNFKIIEKEHFKDDHSIFYYVESNKETLVPKNINLYEKNKKLFLTCINTHFEEIKEINNYISNHKGNIYLFG
jgi:ubiquinone/menaquinone biosynthesis C-methylase UbiE